MATWIEWTPAQQAAWREWVKSRPPVVRALAERLPADRLYRLATTGHRVTIVAYNEDGSLRVNITGDHNLLICDRSVFGIDPGYLTECDLPAAGEPVGTVLTEQWDVEAFLDKCREADLK